MFILFSIAFALVLGLLGFRLFCFVVGHLFALVLGPLWGGSDSDRR